MLRPRPSLSLLPWPFAACRVHLPGRREGPRGRLRQEHDAHLTQNFSAKGGSHLMQTHSLSRTVFVAAISGALAFAGTALAQQSRTLKMQSAVPTASTTQDAFKFFADRVDKL